MNGPAGADGTNGLDALTYKGSYNDTTTTASPDSPITVAITNFNRTPVVGDTVDVIVKKANRQDVQYFANYSVTSVDNSNATLTTSSYVNIKGDIGKTGATGPEGTKGANGKDYLIINRVLTSPGAPVVDGTRSINHEWCNRLAEVGEQFALPILSLQE